MSLRQRLLRTTSTGEFIPEVDGLRTLAIGAIVLHHITASYLRTTKRLGEVALPAQWWDVFPRSKAVAVGYAGHFGVPLFFVLSGFILALPFARAFRTGAPRPNLAAYYLRRVVRLEAPYVVSMIVAFGAIVLTNPGWRTFVPHLWASLAYLHGWIFGQASWVNGVAWSLEVEVQFYLVMPLLALLLAIPSRFWRRALISGATVGLAWMALHFIRDETHPRLAMSLLNYLHFFLAGLLLADVYDTRAAELPRAWWGDALSGASGAAIFLILTRRYDYYYLTPLLIVALYAGLAIGRVGHACITNRWIVVIGGMCYTIYLYHFLIIELLAPWTMTLSSRAVPLSMDLFIQCVLLVPPVVLVSTLLYVVIEKPFMVLSRVVSRRVRGRGSEDVGRKGGAAGESAVERHADGPMRRDPLARSWADSSVHLAWCWAVVVCCAPFLVLAAWNSWAPYSLWFDELYSATVVSETWASVARAVAGEATNPPLYLTVLALWAREAGISEPALRLFSLLCAFGAFGIFVRAGRRLAPAAAVAGSIFFVSCWLFSYYAQEVRPYALLLLISTIATVLDRRRADTRETVTDPLWYGVLIVLALVHYFGLLYGAVLMVGDLLRAGIDRRRIGRAAIAGMLMCAWPLGALVSGGLADSLGGAFWIQVNGPLETAAIAAAALFGLSDGPVSDSFMFLASHVRWLWGVVLAGAAVWAWIVADETSRSRINALTARIVAAIALAMLLDLHTPVSVPRNYIVLLPAVALLYGDLVAAAWRARTAFWQAALIVVLVGAWTWDAGVHATRMMEERWAPRQDWRAMASLVAASDTCRPYCWMSSPGRVHQYYFHSGGGSELRRIRLQDVLERPPKKDTRPILAMQIVDVELARLRRTFPERGCFEPRQAWRGMVVILVDWRDAPPGFVPCE
ncbi:MAG: acyltransferase family protein [Vicinamibacterales bacterium]